MSNISRSKDNQSMKFGQLIEYSMRNIFVEKSYTKYGGEKPFADSFLRNGIEHISGSIVLKFYKVCFYCILILGLSKYSKTKL